jgi:hypothetical protein
VKKGMEMVGEMEELRVAEAKASAEEGMLAATWHVVASRECASVREREEGWVPEEGEMTNNRGGRLSCYCYSSAALGSEEEEERTQAVHHH